MANERWVIPTYNGIEYQNYLISDLGRLVSKAVYHGNSISAPIFGEYRLIQTAKQNRGYNEVYPYGPGGKRKYILLHRLVWSSFVGDIQKGYVIDHKNADKKDNRLINLQMLTYSENMLKHHRVDKLKKIK